MMTISSSLPTQRIHESRIATRSTRAGQKTLLTAEREQDLADRVARGDDHARDELVRSNLGLAAKIARDFAARRLDLDDLVAEGNFGLMRAARDFRSGFGTRFSTYAAYWIKQAIRAALADQSATIRLPMHMVKLLRKWRRAERQLELGLGQIPGFDRVAEALGLTDKQRTLVGHALRTLRFEHGVEEERLASVASPPGDSLERAEELAGLRARMASRLNERERRVIGLRFGLESGDPLTLKEVGKRLGITREGARKIESRAIEKLKAGEPKPKADH
jgi:RNA polymerase primary sigma factor